MSSFGGILMKLMVFGACFNYLTQNNADYRNYLKMLKLFTDNLTMQFSTFTSIP